ncbi:MAG: DUF308 domain-containing protein [Prevotella sp.]|nr:DUF308 domain-containing protein [Prevotella sp.]MCI6617402.1 DUF308 domain-containing protein [Prevotella sp.]MDY4040387.1 DUF308 domain-containing protein [Prevotella sp.]
MKILQSSLFRSLAAVIVGVLLIQYREQTMTWITIAGGALFFISGLISCVIYYSAVHRADEVQMFDAQGNPVPTARPSFPIVGLGSMILGIILALMPTTFITGLMYVLASILILGAISQFAGLAAASKYCHVGLFYWLMPSLILLVGVVAVVRPTTIASAPLFVIGWCMLLYGVVEVINAIKIHQANKVREAVRQAAEQRQQATETQALEQQTTAQEQAPEAAEAD